MSAAVGTSASGSAGAPSRSHTRTSPAPERRLRVGYVSADFRHHSAASAFLPILRSHDRSQVEVVCYSGVPAPDAITAEFQALRRPLARRRRGSRTTTWPRRSRPTRSTSWWTSPGTRPGNRLPVFARKPAPVQVTAWGYATGTGLDAIDAFLADPVVVPPEERAAYAEEVVHLPNVLCYEPAARSLPAVTPLPAAERGYVTFGVVQPAGPSRSRRRCWTTWARVLAGRARLAAATQGPAWTMRGHPRAAASGPPARRTASAVDRLTILGATSRQEHLAAYDQIDLQLDTFPHARRDHHPGGLLMGVPS